MDNKVSAMVASCRMVAALLISTACLFLSSITAARAAYWNVFNVEGETSLTAQIVTYATLGDMLLDANRTGVFNPTTGFAGQNIWRHAARRQPDRRVQPNHRLCRAEHRRRRLGRPPHQWCTRAGHPCPSGSRPRRSSRIASAQAVIGNA